MEVFLMRVLKMAEIKKKKDWERTSLPKDFTEQNTHYR